MRRLLLAGTLLLPACGADCGDLTGLEARQATAQATYDAALVEVTAGRRTLESIDPEHDVLHEATAAVLDLRDRC